MLLLLLRLVVKFTEQLFSRSRPKNSYHVFFVYTTSTPRRKNVGAAVTDSAQDGLHLQ